MSLECTSHLPWSVATSWLSIYHLPLLVIQLLHVCRFHALKDMISVWFLISSLFKFSSIDHHRRSYRYIGEWRVSARSQYRYITSVEIYFTASQTLKLIVFLKLTVKGKKKYLMLYFFQPIKSPEPYSDFIQVKPEAGICILYRASPQLRHCWKHMTELEYCTG